MKTKMNLVITKWSNINDRLGWCEFNTELELEFDMQSIARQLGARALINKSRSSVGLGGAIKAKILKADVVKPS